MNLTFALDSALAMSANVALEENRERVGKKDASRVAQNHL